MNKTAVVLGGTGLVGSALLELLVHSPAYSNVRCVSRRAPHLYHPKLAHCHADFEQLENYAEAFQGDCLFSCLGTTRKQAGSLAAQRRVDVDYQLRAAQIAAQQGMPHYLLVSAMGANANSFSAYMQMKGELEDAVIALNFASTSIFQPSLLTGARDQRRWAESLSAPLMEAACQLPGLKNYRPISGTQLAQAMLERSLENTQGLKRYRLGECFPKSE